VKIVASKTKPKQIRPHTKLDTEKVNQLLTQDLTQREIAAIQNVHPSTITRYLQSLSQTEIQQYRLNRINKLVEDQLHAKALHRRAIKYYLDMEDSQFKAIPEDKKIGILNASNVSAAVSYDKERLEAGLSTNNTLVDVRMLISQVEDERQKTPENSPPPIELNNSLVSSE
jgi:transcriptional regulator with XRE-family HTH domain